ncbi:non-homologous end-joining DNA ligase [Nitrospira sp. Nam74]
MATRRTRPRPSMEQPPGLDTLNVQISNPTKALYPSGYTKGQIVGYYIQVAPFILPHLRDRPVTMKRYPDGVQGEFFYEKNAPSFTPAWVQTFTVDRKSGGQIRYILLNDARTLAWAANLANVEIHPFLHQVPELQRPTSIVFDLDPGEGADILTCAQVALWLKDVLEQLGLQSCAKMSGSKGMQVYVPLNTSVTYQETEPFAKTMAQFLEQEHQGQVVSNMAKALRRGKVLIDWSQNHEKKTTVAVYSLRAKRDEPSVSMPVRWDDLRRALSVGNSSQLYFSPDAALRRLRAQGDLFTPLLTVEQELPAAFKQPHDRNPAVSRALEAYREKRNFVKTPEPSGLPRRSRQGGRRRFVIQKHAASHLHYDLRLEMHGVLKSWAVPKGMPYALNEPRTANATEDHPLDYLSFEGTILKGEYGGGTVMVWDIGTWDIIEGNYYKGRLHIFLDGKKLTGEWLLSRDRERGERYWSITKTDAAMKVLSRHKEDESAFSGRTMAEITMADDAQWHSHRTSSKTPHKDTRPPTETPHHLIDIENLPPATMAFIEPMLAHPVSTLPQGPQWQYEIKLDGYRALAFKTERGVQLLSRRNNVLNTQFPKIASALEALQDGTVLDGEIVALDEQGRPSFNLLQNHRSAASTIVLYVFDVLAYAGKSLVSLPLSKRRHLLELAVDRVPEPIRLSQPLKASVDALIAAAKEHGLEGLIAKDVNSPYQSGERTGVWAKYKIHHGQELVIGGYLPGTPTFDALLVGYYEKDRLLFVGNIRNGFVPSVKADLAKRFKRLDTAVCPFANLPEPKNARRGMALTADVMKTCRWLKPELVAQVEFAEWTENNHLRHSRFVGLRDDKDPLSVIREGA